MTEREDLLKFAEEWKKANPNSQKIQYVVYTLEYPDCQATYNVPWLGKTVTFPSPGIVEDASFYGMNDDDLDQAIKFLNENQDDIQDGCFFGAFILLKVRGIAPFNTPETRMFFRWNEKKQGFIQEEEPESFRGFPVLLGNYSINES